MIKTKFFLITALLAFCFTALGQLAPTNKPARVLVMWDANPEPDIKGYKIYDGLASRVYDRVTVVTNQLTNGIVSISVTNCVITNFNRGATQYFAATAFNTSNLESDFSEEATLYIPAIPHPPMGLKLTNGMAVIELSAQLESSDDVTGPWELFYVYPKNYFDPSNSPQFFRIAMDIDWSP